MNVRPLIVRELRAESRRPANYWVRTLSAALLTALFVWSVWNFAGHPNSLGPALFSALSNGFLLSILIIVSALTGDCISREKREGTLGLLFLTPLSGREIVLGKSLLHTVRAITIILAVAPIIILPFLLGGIPWADVLELMHLATAALCIAIAAGIFASVRTTEWIQSIVWAELYTAAFLVLYWLHLKIAGVALLILGYLVIPLRNYFQGYDDFATAFFTRESPPLLFSSIVLVLAIFYSGFTIQRRWQIETNDHPEPLWVRFFSSSDFWRTAFHWDTKKARDRNPIAWLQEYNWTSRLTKWGWCILLFAAQMRMLFHFRRYIDYQMQLYVLLALGIAFSAAASFRRERQTGALELLLVTPISAPHLILGRLQGVWIHFLPAMAIMSCVWIMGPQWISLPPRYLFYLAGAYFCIPIIGFYCSLITSNILVAWLLTLFMGLLLPYAITETLYFDAGRLGRRSIPTVFFFIQLIEAVVATRLLYNNLAQRRFALGRI